MKKNKISKNWLSKRNRDYYFGQAKIKGYRSRSAFKLIEINKKFNFLNTSTNLLDLGSAPGGWSQVASEKINKGKILAVDIKSMNEINNVSFIQGDINDPQVYKKIISFFDVKINVVISDIAANTTGNKNLDSYRTGELCLSAMDLALKILTTNGVFISKVFMGSMFQNINKKANKSFNKVVRYKPISSKRESKEIYIYCKGIMKI